MRRRRTTTAAEREAIVADYEASGQTRRAFAKANGLKVSTLDSYRRRVAAGNGFVEIAVAGARPAQAELCIALANGWRVEVHWSGLAEAARHGEALRALLLALDGRR
jgi:transposase-like protein